MSGKEVSSCALSMRDICAILGVRSPKVWGERKARSEKDQSRKAKV